MDPVYFDIKDLRTGLFIELDLGWMAHPFPTGSFKITSAKQIDTIRELGLTRVRVDLQRSDPAVDTSLASAPGADAIDPARAQQMQMAQQAKRALADKLRSQQQGLLVCERRFGEAAQQYRNVLEHVQAQPRAVAQACSTMVTGFVGEMLSEGESAIRLLTEAAGDKAALHPVNVTIVSLLLGKALGFAQDELVDLGLAAFLHDIGKLQLPQRVRSMEENFSSVELRMHQEHVAQGVQTAQAMGLSRAVQTIIGQHHELADGTGYPSHVKGTAMGAGARVLALVNRYDNLCNPSRPGAALTPHEALSAIFAQQKHRFDQVALSAFIRMMGVYPPGSVVQLVDERFAMVVSVNSARPLKPRIIVHEPGVPRHEALVVDLEREPSLGIRRSVKPLALPPATMDFLAPRPRIGYFFESVHDASPQPLAA